MMKNYIRFGLTFCFLFIAFLALGQCDERYEKLELEDLPSCEEAPAYQSWDPFYGSHTTYKIEFSDGIKGKVFKGGISKKFFVGTSTGGKYYYINGRAAVRALYFYKKYGCISERYRD